MKLLITFLLVISVPATILTATDEYYWVVEGTTCNEGTSIIRIYNDKHELIYTEKIYGKLDVKNRSTHKLLNRKLRKLKALREKV